MDAQDWRVCAFPKGMERSGASESPVSGALRRKCALQYYIEGKFLGKILAFIT
jgi:hypothetical protein